jgi:hypothetical protein
MAAEFSQQPGSLDLALVQGDEFTIALSFDRNLTGYTLTAPVYVKESYASTGGGSGFVTAVGATAANFTISATAITAGQILIALPESQTSALTPAVGYRWYLRWVDPGLVTRTVLAGELTVTNP